MKNRKLIAGALLAGATAIGSATTASAADLSQLSEDQTQEYLDRMNSEWGNSINKYLGVR